MSKKETKKKAEISDDTIINEAATETVIELSAEEQLSVDLAEEKDKFLRLFAEFENYKKRTAKERIELFKTAQSSFIELQISKKPNSKNVTINTPNYRRCTEQKLNN